MKNLARNTMEPQKSQALKKFLFVHIGCFLMSVGGYFYLIPNGFSTGGVTGIGTVLGHISPITPAVWIWIVNAFLFVMGYIFLGRENSVKTLYCSMLYSSMMYLLERFIPISEPITNQPILEFAYAMLLIAVGSAMLFYVDVSSGGTDIAALILKKFIGIDVGKSLWAVDLITVVSTFFVFNTQVGMFSLIGLFSKGFLIDGVIESLQTCKYFVIITTKGEEITQYILDELDHSATIHEGVGAYTRDGREMIHTVCKRSEAMKLKRKVKQADPYAFIIVTTSSEIIGDGFRNI